MTRVKICGCVQVSDVVAAKEAGADFVGLMFAPRSRRRLSVEDAKLLVHTAGKPLREIEQSDPPPSYHMAVEGSAAWFAEGARALERMLARKRPLTVGVFENQSLEEVNQVADDVGLDLIQLSGSESWDECLLANRQVIKTIDLPKGAPVDTALARLEPGKAIACLLDPSRGQGVGADLELAAALASRVTVWLAGGLTPTNVASAILRVRPWAVDVSTGVESDGAKDAVKISEFVDAARTAISLERSA
jgi:phosphoribosylanthranilate isomerase